MEERFPSLNLLVIRSVSIDRAAGFYSTVGLSMKRESHGTGPEHYSGNVGGSVFEIYPLQKNTLPTSGTRFGFLVDSVDSLIPVLIQAGATLIKEPYESEWGKRAVIKDPDGHIVELLQRK